MDVDTNLFQGYKAAKDKRFVDYFETKEEKYEEGETMEVETLMNHAHNKYKILKLRNMWAAPSLDEEKILALEVNIEKMERAKVKNKTEMEKSKGKRHATSQHGCWLSQRINPLRKSLTEKSIGGALIISVSHDTNPRTARERIQTECS